MVVFLHGANIFNGERSGIRQSGEFVMRVNVMGQVKSDQWETGPLEQAQLAEERLGDYVPLDPFVFQSTDFSPLLPTDYTLFGLGRLYGTAPVRLPVWRQPLKLERERERERERNNISTPRSYHLVTS